MSINIGTATFAELSSFLETQSVTGTGAAVFYSGKDGNGKFNSQNAQDCANSLPGGGYTIHNTAAGKTLGPVNTNFLVRYFSHEKHYRRAV